MDTQTQIDRLIELAIVQRTELKELVAQLPQLREHLNAEVERAFEEAEPQLRADLEEFIEKQSTDATAKTGSALEAKIAELSANLERTTQARYNAIIAEREENARLAGQAEQKIAAHAASLPGAVKEIVTAELARFPRAGEIDQLRKEFAEPRGLNPRGKWQAGEVYNKLDLVTVNGDSFVSNIDDNRERPSRNAANWTLSAARGQGGGGGITSLNDVLNAPTSGQIIGSENGQYVPKTLVAGANITINETSSTITIVGDEGEISLQDGTAAAPSLFFTNDTDTGLYRPGTNQLGISLGGSAQAVLTSTTFTFTPNLVVSGTGTINGTSIPASKTLVVTTDKLSALASTSSSELAGVISDETGTGALVFANTPTLVTPNIGAATGSSVNLSGNATVGGTLTVTGAGSIQGLTVGRGAGAVYLNTAVGSGALATNTTGSNNSAMGFNALYNNTTGSNNSAMGVGALYYNTTGGNNSATGFYALLSNTTGSSNSAVGTSALQNNTTGSNNSAMGLYALFSNTTGATNSAVGTGALQNNTTGSSNSATGYQALYLNTTGSNNSAVGRDALYSNTTGVSNIAVGVNALYGNTTGGYNSAVGYQALYANTTGDYNTAVGLQALHLNTTGQLNSAMGSQALFSNTTGSGNSAMGFYALNSNTTGSSNSAMGRAALYGNTTGNNNTATGYQALLSNTTGDYNTAHGFQAGYGTGTNSNTTGSNNTFIGNESVGASATASNVITLGNGSIATLRCQVTTITALSDARDKKNIVGIPAGLKFIEALRPVAFVWNTRDGAKVDIPEFGFIAQDLQQAQAEQGVTVPNLVSTENPEKLEASAGTLIPVLVKAIQELKAELDFVKTELATIRGN